MSPSDQSAYSNLEEAIKYPDIREAFSELIDETTALNRFLLIQDEELSDKILKDEELFIKACVERYRAIKKMANDFNDKIIDKLNGESNDE